MNLFLGVGDSQIDVWGLLALAYSCLSFSVLTPYFTSPPQAPRESLGYSGLSCMYCEPSRGKVAE